MAASNGIFLKKQGIGTQSLIENSSLFNETAAARCAAIRQDAAQKADKLKTERMQKAKADLAAAKQSAETAAAAEQRTAQQETAALAEDIRKKAQQNSANVIRAIREAITG